MAIQSVNLGAPPSGAGGDTFRTTGAKMNENFSNPAHAASRMVGVEHGNVMAVGAFGLGSGESSQVTNINNLTARGFYDVRPDAVGAPSDMGATTIILGSATAHGWMIGKANLDSSLSFRTCYAGVWQPWGRIHTTSNTTVDSNGFIKAASPILKLFADKIDANDEAKQQESLFEKLSPGDYLIKGSSGFAQAGWYIESPKDANGNVLFSVIYGTLENGDISVKAYKKKFDLETASIVADLAQPVDIPEGRWIDIRLQELPQPEFEPTGIAKAVSEMMNGAEQ